MEYTREFLPPPRAHGWAGQARRKEKFAFGHRKVRAYFFTGCLAVFKKHAGGQTEFLPQPLLPPVLFRKFHLTKAKTEGLSSVITHLQARSDSNREPRFWRPMFYH